MSDFLVQIVCSLFVKLLNFFVAAYERFSAVHRGHQVFQPQRKHGANCCEDFNPQRLPGRRRIHASICHWQNCGSLLLKPRLVHRKSHLGNWHLCQKRRRVSTTTTLHDKYLKNSNSNSEYEDEMLIPFPRTLYFKCNLRSFQDPSSKSE